MTRVRERQALNFRTWSKWGITGLSDYGPYQTDFLSNQRTEDQYRLSSLIWRRLERRMNSGEPMTPHVRELIRLNSELGDTGDEFISQSSYWDVSVPTVNVQVPWFSPYVRYVRGTILPTTFGAVERADLIGPSSDAKLYDWGAHVIASVAPNKPQAGLATALMELREGLPSIPGLLAMKSQTKRALAGNVASEHLNLEFGWKPLVADFFSMLDAVKQFDDRWDQALKDSGRRIRRKFHPPAVTTTVSTDYGSNYGYPSVDTNLYKAPGRLVRTETTLDEIWFSGAFRYALPSRSERSAPFRSWLAKARWSYGLDMSPATLWNLAPWSWLSDWILDTGPLMANLGQLSSDGMVLQYGYVMERRKVVTNWSLSGLVMADNSVLHPTVSLIRECKRRVRASSFGFGLPSASFSQRQLGILASLGITRVLH